MLSKAGGGITMKAAKRVSPFVRTVTAALLLMLFAGMLTSCKPEYASGYYDGLNKVDPEIEEAWNVRKDTKQDITRVIITHSSDVKKKDYADYLVFDVFDNNSDAMKEYEWQYDYMKNNEDSEVWEEGGNWFLGQTPYMLGYSYAYVYYVEDNVLISAVIEEYRRYDGSCIFIPPEPLEKPFDRMLLKDYIIENAPELKHFAINEVLGY